MVLSTALSDPSVLLVADASTIINLVATRDAATVLSALSNRVAVLDVVCQELESGRSRGRTTCDGLTALVTRGLVEIVELPDQAEVFFEQLVVGSAAATLDDGEAATIAYCVACDATALIDERKATRMCAERFPTLRLACSVDVLRHPEVQRVLGAEALVHAVFNALQSGKMGVLPHHFDWVVSLIGEDRAAQCPSLPTRLRVSKP